MEQRAKPVQVEPFFFAGAVHLANTPKSIQHDSPSKSKEETFPSLNQTGEGSSLDLILGYFHVDHIFFSGGASKLGMVFRGP